MRLIFWGRQVHFWCFLDFPSLFPSRQALSRLSLLLPWHNRCQISSFFCCISLVKTDFDIFGDKYADQGGPFFTGLTGFCTKSPITQ